MDETSAGTGGVSTMAQFFDAAGEMGASGAGEIEYSVQLVEPDVVVITNADKAHIEGFGDLDETVLGDGARPAGTQSAGYRKEKLHANYDATKIGRDGMDCHFVDPDNVYSAADPTEVETDDSFHPFRQALVDHFKWFRRNRKGL